MAAKVLPISMEYRLQHTYAMILIAYLRIPSEPVTILLQNQTFEFLCAELAVFITDAVMSPGKPGADIF